MICADCSCCLNKYLRSEVLRTEFGVFLCDDCYEKRIKICKECGNCPDKC